MSKADSSGNSFKIVVVGSSGVGKTSVVRQLVDNKFNEEGQPTIGVEFKTYNLTTDGENIKLQIWDTAGQERFRSVSKAYFRNAVGAVLVYDITSRTSFDELTQWMNDLQSLAAKNAYIILIGNKSDLATQRQIEESEAEEFAKRYNIVRLETSAKTGDHVADTFVRLGQGILKNVHSGEITSAKSQGDSANLNTTTDKAGESSGKGSCC